MIVPALPLLIDCPGVGVLNPWLSPKNTREKFWVRFILGFGFLEAGSLDKETEVKSHFEMGSVSEIAVYQACGIVTEACGVDGGHRAMNISEHGNMK